MTEEEYNARKSQYWLADAHPDLVHALDLWVNAERGGPRAEAWKRVEEYLKENLQ